MAVISGLIPFWKLMRNCHLTPSQDAPAYTEAPLRGAPQPTGRAVLGSVSRVSMQLDLKLLPGGKASQAGDSRRTSPLGIYPLASCRELGWVDGRS